MRNKKRFLNGSRKGGIMKKFLIGICFILILFSFALYNLRLLPLIINAFSIIFLLLFITDFKITVNLRDIISIISIYTCILFLYFYWKNNMAFDFNEFISSFVIFMIYLIIFSVYFNNYQNIPHKYRNIFVQIYKYFLIVNFIVILAQFILEFTLNFRLLFPWQPTRSQRQMGIMSEPSHNAMIYLPFIFENRIFDHRFGVLMMTLITLLSASASFFVLYIFYLVLLLRNLKLKINNLLAVMAIILLVSLFVFGIDYSNLNLFIRLSRIGISSDASSFTRLYKGFVLFENNGFVHNVLGDGPGNNFLSVNRYDGKYYTLVNLEGEMMSGVFANVFSYGIILAIAIYIFIYVSIKKAHLETMFFFLILYTFYSGGGFSNYTFYNLLIVTSLIDLHAVNKEDT